jgi:uncharacterized protein YjbI with pentapeptide repeats
MTEHCRYEVLGDERYACKHRVLRDGFCVFHVPKPSADEKSRLSEQQLQDALKVEKDFAESFWRFVNIVEGRSSIESADFRGFCFPSFSFHRRVFTKELDFTEAKFQRADFSNAIFKSTVIFDHARFQGGVLFMQVVFSQRAQFHSTLFGIDGVGNANFYRAQFKEEADFLSTQFDQRTYFRNASFAKKATFASCEFTYGASFTNAVFKRPADFSYSKFDGRTTFYKAVFQDSVTFIGGSISDVVQFAGDKEGKLFSQDSDFTNLRLRKEGTLLFERVSLARASFGDTNLEDCVFRNVTWWRVKSKARIIGLNRQQALWDEFRPIKKTANRDFSKIAENYSQLVLNNERKRDYDTAENFHIGEMEMRRRKLGEGIHSPALRKIREWANAFGLYRASSSYGTSYSQAFAVLLLLVLSFSLIFLYTGFKQTRDGGNGPQLIIEYDLVPNSTHHPVSASQWLADYGSAVSLSLSIITFQKDRFYEPLEGWSRLWLYVTVIILTAQAALVLLAIRRRFKR